MLATHVYKTQNASRFLFGSVSLADAEPGLDKLPWRDDACFSPCWRKILQVACDEIVGLCRRGAFNEDVVVRVGTDADCRRRFNPEAFEAEFLKR